MKILIRVLAAVAIILAGYLITFAIINKYEDTKVNQKLADQSRQAEANRQAQDLKDAQAVSASFEARYNALAGECQKGVAAYSRLPALIKSQLPAPTCPATE